MKGIDTELHRIFIQKVNRRCLRRVTIFEGDFELKFIQEGQSFVLLDTLSCDIDNQDELSILTGDVLQLETELGLGILQDLYF